MRSALFCLMICTCYGLLLPVQSSAQAVPEHVSNKAVYNFLDELATAGITKINSAVKPYTKQFIATRLSEAQKADSLLNKRQRAELNFYLNAYQIWDKGTDNPYIGEKVNLLNKYSDHAALSFTHLGFVYRDSVFTVKAAPIWGYRYRSNDSAAVSHYWGGIEASGTIGQHIGIYASLRDNSTDEIFAKPGYLTRQEGGNYKNVVTAENGLTYGEYSEMRGGIYFSWKWGRIGLVKDHVQWGDNYHGANIVTSRVPSFAMIKMHLKPVEWFEFDYFHGWLVSEVIDSTRSYISQFSENRTVFRPKNIAANFYTLHPWQHTSLSAGNSIVYSDLGGAHPAYMIPFLFYKSVDHTLNHNIQNQNSQLFFNVSTRAIRNLHLYGSLFVDEFKKDRVGDPDKHNFFSWKGGAKLQNWPVQNVTIYYEFTQSSPMTYRHRLQSTTFATNQYNLGHYLSDNSREHYISATIKPLNRLRIRLAWWKAFHANHYNYDIQEEIHIDEYPVLQDKTWQNTTFKLSGSFELLQNVYLKLIYRESRIKGFAVDGHDAQYYLDMFTPKFYHGHQQTLSFQFNIGF